MENRLKKFIFKKDIFSNPTINLKNINTINFKKQLKFFGFNSFDKIKLYIPINSSATNSKNFIIKFNEKFYLLKKESIKKEKFSNKKKRLKELTKIYKSSFFIPLASNYKNLYQKDNSIWSIYHYFEGKHFSGKKNELNNISKNYFKIQNKFKKIIIFKKSYDYFNNNDCEIVNKYKKNYKLWDKILNLKDKKLKLSLYNYFLSEWNRIKLFKSEFRKLKKKYSHYDLHPHNIMIKGNKIKIIDLNSITYMPIEFSTAFSALKLCRQTIYLNNIKKYRVIGLKFLRNLEKKYCNKLNKKKYIYDFANTELMRRICIILKANLNEDKSMNHILPILISNIIESKLIFKNIKFSI